MVLLMFYGMYFTKKIVINSIVKFTPITAFLSQLWSPPSTYIYIYIHIHIYIYIYIYIYIMLLYVVLLMYIFRK